MTRVLLALVMCSLLETVTDNKRFRRDREERGRRGEERGEGLCPQACNDDGRNNRPHGTGGDGLAWTRRRGHAITYRYEPDEDHEAKE